MLCLIKITPRYSCNTANVGVRHQSINQSIINFNMYYYNNAAIMLYNFHNSFTKSIYRGSMHLILTQGLGSKKRSYGKTRDSFTFQDVFQRRQFSNKPLKIILLKIIESLLLKNTTLRRAFKDVYGILKYILYLFLLMFISNNKFLQHKLI
jgi:hypothetical protein